MADADDDDDDDDEDEKPTDKAKNETEEGEKPSDSKELLSPRAEVFRSKLMNEFHLLESIGAGGALDTSDEPHLRTRDALDDGLCRNMMMREPNSLIQFQIYSDKVCIVDGTGSSFPRSVFLRVRNCRDSTVGGTLCSLYGTLFYNHNPKQFITLEVRFDAYYMRSRKLHSSQVGVRVTG